MSEPTADVTADPPPDQPNPTYTWACRACPNFGHVSNKAEARREAWRHVRTAHGYIIDAWVAVP